MAANNLNSATLANETPFSLRKYLYYSTLVGVFSGAALVRLPAFDLQLFYLLMIGNLLLMLLLEQSSIPTQLILLTLYLLTSGMIGIFHGTVTAGLVAKQLLGITISAFYFYNFFQLQDDRYDRAFHHYAIGAYWASIAGFFILPLQFVLPWPHHRLQSIFLEPSHFVTVCVPAFYYFSYQWMEYRRYGRQVLVMLAAFLLSTSALGILAIAVGLFLLLSRRRFWRLVAPLLMAGIIATVAFVSADFRMRLVDTALAAQSLNVEGTNLSTYALISNMYVTARVLEESPIIGNGLGSHPVSHEHYLEQIPGVQQFVQLNYEQLNRYDAASLALRALSELGVLGLIGILAFIWHFWVPGHSRYAQVSNAILLYFFLKLLRNGHYFGPEQFFFILIYVFNYRRYMETKKAGERVHP